MEGCELYAIPVDFADVEVFTDFGDFGGGDVVGSAPDALCGLMLFRSQALFMMARKWRSAHVV